METENQSTDAVTDKNPGEGICGIVMPMSGSGEYSEEHWAQIRTIIEDAAEEAGFKARIVSTNTSQGIIQSNLVNNLDQDEIVVCDLSNNNPNVMIELGMRIAFGKPFILIKDKLTKFSSDIGLIIHELYTKDMLYPEMKAFRNKLSVLIKEKAKEVKSPGYKSFISTFQVKEVDFNDIQPEKIGVKELLTELVNSVNILKGARGINQNSLQLEVERLEQELSEVKREMSNQSVAYETQRSKDMTGLQGYGLNRFNQGPFIGHSFAFISSYIHINKLSGEALDDFLSRQFQQSVDLIKNYMDSPVWQQIMATEWRSNPDPSNEHVSDLLVTKWSADK